MDFVLTVLEYGIRLLQERLAFLGHFVGFINTFNALVMIVCETRHILKKIIKLFISLYNHLQRALIARSSFPIVFVAASINQRF